jgi:hypothetical protein
MIDDAITELAPLVGTRTACTAVGRPQANHYRRHRTFAADAATVDLGHVGATYFTGTVNFTNRSVSVDGVIRALSTSCRRVYASAYDASGNPLDRIRSTSTWCTTSPTQHIPLEANVPDGAAIVVVQFTDASANQIDICSVVRGDTACT